MKQLSRPVVLTAICALGGLLCLLLRQWLFGTMDQEGLLDLSHPANILCWILTGLVLLPPAIVFFTWDKQVTCAFPLGPVSGVSTLLMAGGYAAAAWHLLCMPFQLLSILAGALALICLLCSLLIAMGQFRNQRMHPLLYCPGVLFFLCYLILCYSGWSGEPQTQLFFYQMMAAGCMLITVFCKAELAAGKVSGRNYLVFSRIALFMSIGAISHSEEVLLHLCFALWLLLDSCYTFRKEPKNPENPAQGE